ncbi:hypothetical protein MHLP_03780 [Candidatus Mycoplasma haematolamae str. Purdue]|uniref:Uncharacterized protein n=1 Tax=Mycoplasma haematolamae (strain Purdue) TaxID=1212765 RepID=I7CGE3_MYCHA|nr:hypothetical protein MHLP_03780 [Candidatus Mycoplasma haematolamae str. Purdue]
MSFLVNSGATRSWKSITWLGSLIPDIKKNYQTAESYTKSSYKFLKDNWEHLWKFLKLYFRYIDLEKLYKLLSKESKRRKLAEVFQESNKSTLEGMVKNLQSIVSKSGEIGFYAGKPFDKIVQSLFEGSSNLGKLATRLGYLEGYIKDRNSKDKAQVESLVEFFSSNDDKIQSFVWDWFKNTRTQR